MPNLLIQISNFVDHSIKRKNYSVPNFLGFFFIVVVVVHQLNVNLQQLFQITFPLPQSKSTSRWRYFILKISTLYPQYICTLTRARRIIVSCWVDNFIINPSPHNHHQHVHVHHNVAIASPSPPSASQWRQCLRCLQSSTPPPGFSSQRSSTAVFPDMARSSSLSLSVSNMARSSSSSLPSFRVSPVFLNISLQYFLSFVLWGRGEI